MNRRSWFWVAIVGLNVALAVGAAVLAPSEGAVGTTSDRVGYDYVGAHPLERDCPYNIFCYRVLAPTILEHVPLSPVQRWRAADVVANATAGVVLASVAASGAGGAAAVLASILFQTSFAATFAVFDPFTPDAVVFLASALLTVAWLRDKAATALAVGLIGVFAKETVALVLTAVATGAWFDRRRPSRAAWLTAAGLTWAVLLGFHLVMDRLAGWSESGSGSADLVGGAWLGRWLADTTLTPWARLFYVFIPFGFAWLFAALGVRGAPDRLRTLALGALIVLPWLVYVQTAERALGTACFVVIPLAALFLARVPLALGLGAAITNGLLTARVGLSSAWLPPVPYLLALAAIVCGATLVRAFVTSRSSAVTLVSSSRVTSSR